ncbi:MAG: transglycosylase domain-containing protein [Micromonosporaceae bacterium]
MSTRDFTRPQRPQGPGARDSERRERFERERNARVADGGADDPYGIYRPARGNGAASATTVRPPGAPAHAPAPGSPGRSGAHSARGARRVRGLLGGRWTWKKIAAIAAIAFGLGVAGLAILIGIAYAQTPVPTAASALALAQESTVYFSDNKTEVGSFGSIDRHTLRSDQIPDVVKNAVLAAEDRGFYSEPGISPSGTLRAAIDDLTGHGGLQGGSTITQQFVRNYYLGIGTQQTMSRKIKEIFVSLKIGRQKSKDWILTNYLNTIPLGRAYGVGAAAEAYFGKPVGKLSVSQAATLAAIIQLPSYYSTPAGHKALVARWNYVLDGMVTMGKLSPSQRAAQKFPKFVKDQFANTWSGYRGYIMTAVENELETKYHYTETQIESGGLRIETTFDKRMMDAAYRAVNENEKEMAANGVKMPSYAHIGLSVVQPGTGDVVAMYSGPNWAESTKKCRRDLCRVDMAMQSRNQVGSSFKPYVLAAAVHQGISIKSILNGNTPLCVPDDYHPMMLAVRGTSMGNSISCPTTPDGWYGVANDMGDITVSKPMDMTHAISYSLNTAFVDLTHRIGTKNVISMARSLGVNTAPYPTGSDLSQKVHQTGIAIGIASLTAQEQATTFASFANNGTYVSAHVIKKLFDSHGNRVPLKITRMRVLSPGEAADTDYALSQDTVYGTATNAAMTDGRQIIGKTGTTERGQAAWFVGAIPQYSAAVGMFTNKQSQTLNGVGGLPGYGGEWPAKIWHTFAEEVFAGLPAEQFPPPVFGGQTLKLAQLPVVRHQRPPRNPGCNPFNPFCGRGKKTRPPCVSGVVLPGCPSQAPSPTPSFPVPNPTPSLPAPGGGAAAVIVQRSGTGSGSG